MHVVYRRAQFIIDYLSQQSNTIVNARLSHENGYELTITSIMFFLITFDFASVEYHKTPRFSG